MLAARVLVRVQRRRRPSRRSRASPQSRAAGRAVLSLCKSLLLLRDRLRLRPILTTFGFCMKGLLYRTAVPTPGRRSPITDTILQRDMFPALATNDFAYLNTGSSGPPPYYVMEAMREADDLCSGPAYLEGVGLFYRQAGVRLAGTRGRRAARRGRPRRRGPHPEHHPRHEPGRRLDRLARGRRERSRSPRSTPAASRRSTT